MNVGWRVLGCGAFLSRVAATLRFFAKGTLTIRRAHTCTLRTYAPPRVKISGKKLCEAPWSSAALTPPLKHATRLDVISQRVARMTKAAAWSAAVQGGLRPLARHVSRLFHAQRAG
jgi:hypothetical protein